METLLCKCVWKLLHRELESFLSDIKTRKWLMNLNSWNQFAENSWGFVRGLMKNPWTAAVGLVVGSFLAVTFVLAFPVFVVIAAITGGMAILLKRAQKDQGNLRNDSGPKSDNNGMAPDDLDLNMD